MSDTSTDDIDRQGWNHCYDCGARADVERYDTFYKEVRCRDCGAVTYIPKRCANTFDEFREFVKRSVSPTTDNPEADP